MKKLATRFDEWIIDLIDGISGDLQRKGVLYPLLIMVVWFLCALLATVSSLHLAIRVSSIAFPQLVLMTGAMVYGTYTLMPFYWKAYRNWNDHYFAICSMTAFKMRSKWIVFRLSYLFVIIIITVTHIAISEQIDRWTMVRISENFLSTFPVLLFHLFGCSYPRLPVKEPVTEERPEDESVAAL